MAAVATKGRGQTDAERDAQKATREKRQADIETRKRKLQRWAALKTERSSRDPVVKDIARVMLPRNTRFHSSDRNKPGTQHHEIYDSSGMTAVQLAASGLITSAMPQSSPYFKLEDANPDLNENKDVQLWYEDATELAHEVIRRSNFYKHAPEACKEIIALGQGCLLVDEDYEDVVRYKLVTFGEYCIAEDHKGEPDTFYREFDMTAAQVVAKFGEDRCSLRVRDLAKNQPDSWVTILHAIEPREQYDPEKADDRNMPWSSCYIEVGGGEADAGLLSESGFDHFPVLVPRWGGISTYGNGPGDDALPFVLSLQLLELDAARVANKLADPPMKKGPAMKNREVEGDAGGETWDADGEGVEPVYVPHHSAVEVLRLKQAEYRQQVREILHVDKFLMLNDAAQATGSKQMNQMLVGELRDEKMTILGPFVENLNGGLIGKNVEIVLRRLMAVGALPPPPPAMSGSYKITFVSKLAQVMRANGLASTQQYVADLSVVADMQVKLRDAPVMDKFDADAWADEAAQRRGVSPKINRSTKEVQGIRDSRAEMQAKVAQMQAGNLQADTAHKLSDAKTSEPSALTALAGGGA